MIVLGIDAGGSSTRWLLKDNDLEIAKSKTKSISGLFYDRANNKNLDNLNSLLKDVLKVANPEAVLAGITGFTKDSLASQTMTKLIADKFKIRPAKVKLENDMYIAYRNAFELGQGVLIYAGTGSIAYYQDQERIIRAGGRGYLIDDAGGGFWIGKEALKAVLRYEDSAKSPTSPLATEIYKNLNTNQWPEIKEQIYAGGRKKLASLAPSVSIAASNNDETAIAILTNAGQELARITKAILGQLDAPNSVAFAGGITNLSPILTNSLKQALPDGISFSLVSTEAVEAAARLALEL